MDKSRNIYVAGNYIASQTIGTQILHAEHVHQESAFCPQHSESCIAEDVAFEEVSTRFRYITEKCVKNAMVDHVEDHLHIACMGTAEALWKTIHEFELMGYLRTQEIDATKIYNALSEHFGELPFGVVNFRKYR